MRIFKVLTLWALFLLLLLGLVYLALMNQPRSVDPETLEWKEDNDSELTALQKADEYLSMLKKDALSDVTLDEIDTYITNTHSALLSSRYTSRELQQKLGQLNSIYSIKRSADLLAESTKAQEQGEAALESGDVEEAVKYLRIAADIQKDVNEKFTTSPPRDYSRFSSLNAKVHTLQAKPLESQSKQLEAEALEEEKSGSWSKAAALYQEAYNLQMEINQKYQGTPSSDYRRSRNLLERQKTASAGILFEGVEEKIRKAQTEIDQGNPEGAKTFFDQAEKEMLELIEKYPANPFASRARLSELVIRRENALGKQSAQDILQRYQTLQGIFKQSLTEGVSEQLLALQKQIDQFQTLYPNSTLISEELRFLVLYLLRIEKEIPNIQQQARDMLSQQADAEGNFWSKIEVPQNLYQSVMGHNPGKPASPEHPVTYVNLEEAHEFCRRLSAILGDEVRLPKLEEYRKLFFSSDMKNNWTGWHNTNSPEGLHEVGKSQPGLLGIQDLVGNVAEWAEGGLEGSRQGVVVGGSIESDEAEFRSLPVKTEPNRTRSPVIGFRFLLVQPAESPS